MNGHNKIQAGKNGRESVDKNTQPCFHYGGVAESRAERRVESPAGRYACDRWGAATNVCRTLYSDNARVQRLSKLRLPCYSFGSCGCLPGEMRLGLPAAPDACGVSDFT